MITKLQDNHTEALAYAVKHSQAAEEFYTKSHKEYATALLLQAQCSRSMPELDHEETLGLLNKALEIVLKSDGGVMLDPHLGRVYQEKGNIVRMLAVANNDCDEHNLKAL